MKSSRNRKLALKGVLSKVFTLKFLKQHTCEWSARTSCLGFAIWHSHRDLRASSDYGPGTGNSVQVALEGRKAEVYSGFTGLVLSIVFLWENTQFGKVLVGFLFENTQFGRFFSLRRNEWNGKSIVSELKWSETGTTGIRYEKTAKWYNPETGKNLN